SRPLSFSLFPYTTLFRSNDYPDWCCAPVYIAICFLSANGKHRLYFTETYHQSCRYCLNWRLDSYCNNAIYDDYQQSYINTQYYGNRFLIFTDSDVYYLYIWFTVSDYDEQ